MNGDKLFKLILLFSVIILLIVVAGFMFILLDSSLPILSKEGISNIFSTDWNPVKEKYGILPFLVGTLITSFLSLAISLPFSISISLFLGEYYKQGTLHNVVKSAIELLAGIPSLIYGFWGLFIVVPIIRSIQIDLGITPYGVGLLTSSIILAIMIIPYSASLGQEIIKLVPNDLKEAGYAMGATNFEVVKKIIIPYSFSGLMAGVILSLGRALGETMAVTMVIGNSNNLPKSIFDPANTMASLIANEFNEASGEVYIASLIEIGLILFVITTIINYLGKLIIRKFAPHSN